jgi:hypothetical protein
MALIENSGHLLLKMAEGELGLEFFPGRIA